MDATDSPLEAVAGAAGPRAIEAFSVLGNEMRLSILLALWETFDPWESDNAVSFSELRERLGSPDSGQFNYHLGKLEGYFLRKTDRGYELRRAGHLIVRSVVAGTGIEHRALDPTEIDRACYICEAPTMVTYEDEWLFWVCTSCDGLLERADVPDGTIAGDQFDPAGLTDRTPAEVLNAAYTGVPTLSGLGGVCDQCSGPMEGWLQRCDDHAAEGVCPRCGWREGVTARFYCTVCKHHHHLAPWYLSLDHPAVVAFYYDHGIPLQFEDGVAFQPRIESHVRRDIEQELVSEEPLRLQVTVRRDGDALRLTLDDELNVLEVGAPP